MMLTAHEQPVLRVGESGGVMSSSVESPKYNQSLAGGGYITPNGTSVVHGVVITGNAAEARQEAIAKLAAHDRPIQEDKLGNFMIETLAGAGIAGAAEGGLAALKSIGEDALWEIFKAVAGTAVVTDGIPEGNAGGDAGTDSDGGEDGDVDAGAEEEEEEDGGEEDSEDSDGGEDSDDSDDDDEDDDDSDDSGDDESGDESGSPDYDIPGSSDSPGLVLTADQVARILAAAKEAEPKDDGDDGVGRLPAILEGIRLTNGGGTAGGGDTGQDGDGANPLLGDDKVIRIMSAARLPKVDVDGDGDGTGQPMPG